MKKSKRYFLWTACPYHQLNYVTQVLSCHSHCVCVFFKGCVAAHFRLVAETSTGCLLAGSALGKKGQYSCHLHISLVIIKEKFIFYIAQGFFKNHSSFCTLSTFVVVALSLARTLCLLVIWGL